MARYEIGRRAFLQGSGLAAVGAFLSGCSQSPADKDTAFPDPGTPVTSSPSEPETITGTDNPNDEKIGNTYHREQQKAQFQARTTVPAGAFLEYEIDFDHTFHVSYHVTVIDGPALETLVLPENDVDRFVDGPVPDSAMLYREDVQDVGTEDMIDPGSYRFIADNSDAGRMAAGDGDARISVELAAESRYEDR